MLKERPIIAGSIPFAGFAAKEAAWHEACRLFGTDDISLVFSADDNLCRYLATPSENLVGIETSPLSVAVTAKEDGVYFICDEDNIVTAVTRKGASMSVSSMTESAFRTETAFSDLAAIDVAAINEGQIPWSRMEEIRRARVEKVAKPVFIAGLVLFAVSVIGYSVTYVIEGQKDVATKVAVEKVQSQVDRLNSTLGARKSLLKEVDSLGAMALENGGWIEEFALEAGKTSWRVIVQADADPEKLKKFGSGVVAIPRGDQLVIEKRP